MVGSLYPAAVLVLYSTMRLTVPVSLLSIRLILRPSLTVGSELVRVPNRCISLSMWSLSMLWSVPRWTVSCSNWYDVEKGLVFPWSSVTVRDRLSITSLTVLLDGSAGVQVDSRTLGTEFRMLRIWWALSASLARVWILLAMFQYCSLVGSVSMCVWKLSEVSSVYATMPLSVPTREVVAMDCPFLVYVIYVWQVLLFVDFRSTGYIDYG